MTSMDRLILLFIASACLAFGQSATTGTVQGVVADSSGGAIAQALIVARHLSTGVARTMESSSSGQFQAAGLAAGEYSLRFDKPGFNPVVVEPLSISAGQTVTQRVTMSLASVADRIEVQEQAEALKTSANTADATLGGERIEEAPAQNRGFLSFVLASPAVAASSGANTMRSMVGLRNPANDSGFVFAGMRGRNNSILIDGVDNRDETTGGNRVAVGLEMVQEVRASAMTVSPEFGGAAGGLVNIVTHSGQNLWHGDATFFLQNEKLNARNSEVESGEKPTARKYQPGVSSGGPLLRDRTYFFFALEQVWESAGERSDSPARDVERINAALRSPLFARSGVRAIDPGQFTSAERDTEFSIKGTHIVNAANLLTARYAFSRGRVRKDVQSGDNFTDVSARGSSLVTDHSLVGSWSSTPNASMTNDLRVQWAERSAELTPNSVGPMFEIPGVVTFGQSARLDQQRTERHAEAVESFQWVRGGHLFSLGSSVHGVWFDSRLANRFHGVYLFPSLDAFLAGRPDIAMQAFGHPATRYRTVPVAFWFRDLWQIAPGLTLEAGLRYDRQWLPGGIPETNRNVAPRLGLAWHPGGKSNWVFRAGAGLFYDRYPLAFLNDAIQKNGARAFEQYLTGEAAASVFRLYQGGSIPAPLAGVEPAAYQATGRFLSTYARKVTAGVERRLDRDTTFTAEYSNVHGVHLPRTRRLGGQYALEQIASSTYSGVAFTVNRRLSKELTYLVTYNLSRTHDDASDYDEQPQNPDNLRAEWALSRQHQRHRIALSGVYELPFEALEGVTLAPVFTWGSGRPLNTLLTTGSYPITARPAGFGRNSQLTPRTVSVDLRVMKTILVKEGRARVQFGVEAFNLLNHTNRLRVSPYYTQTFGAMVEAQGPRQVQLMMQFEY